MSMTTRLQLARKAVRPALKGRMMLTGPAGAGKTRSGLMIATALAEGGPILGIDTEKESMLTYADDFDFTHLPWQPPFNALELAEVIGEAGKSYAVIQLDSMSHFWRKEGGVLDVAGGKFTGWKEARPIQEALVESILNCGAHVVLCVRSKVEHTQETDERGKHTVRKLGMAAQQDDDLEFEMNVAVEMSMDHTATISKSRTTVLPIGRTFHNGQITEMARIYGEWLKGGEAPAAKDIVADLQARMNAIESSERRKAVKNEFVARFGRPEQLRESAVAEAVALVESYEPERVEGDGKAPKPPVDPAAPPCEADAESPDVAPPASAPVAEALALDADPDAAPFV